MYYAYIVECKDGTLYSGATNNLERRLAQHNDSKRGARYTRSRRPVVLRYSEAFRTLGKALSREAAYKRMTRTEKLALCSKKR